MAYRVQIYDARIAGMFAPAGEVGRVAEADSREIMALADLTAPVGPPRAGQVPLKGAHRRRVVPSVASYSVRYYVENTSDHALFVHEGTSGPIIPVRRRVLALHLPTGIVLAHSVRGQRSQPWLRDAANTVLLAKYHLRAT